MVTSKYAGQVLLAVLLLFLLLFTRPGGCGTVRSHEQECFNPEECCKYTMFSSEFNACCAEHGCCPIDCRSHTADAADSQLTQCGAWACCRFQENSPEFEQCCSEHGCCPLCSRVPSGCGFNMLMYKWGQSVKVFKEMCAELVCGARLSTEEPFLTAEIVPVRLPQSQCQFECNTCQFSCVDHTGLIQDEGASWQPDQCHKCVCTDGRTVCQTLLIACPSKPYSHCIEIEGSCCPTWNCTVTRGCVDDTGEHHKLYSTWQTSPCITHICTLSGILKRTRICGPPPHPNCREVLQPGECCPRWECGGCTDNDGYHELHSTWESDECTRRVCTQVGILNITKECVPQPRPNCREVDIGECCPKWECGEDCTSVTCPVIPPGDDCHLVVDPLACCPKWNCTGCFVDGIYHAQGSVWKTEDPCLTSTCTHTGVKTVHVHCPRLPQPPHPSCTSFVHSGDCCPKWNCSTCITEDGVHHELNSVWHTSPCVSHKCTRAGILSITQKCLDPPHSNCEKFSEGKCCPSWRCGPDCSKVQCASRPSKWCTPYRPPLACCDEWNCRGCEDELGNRYDVGEEWTNDPCSTSRCTESGIKISRNYCPITQRPHHSCNTHTPEGECCPRWNCSACLDDTGEYHDLNSMWQTSNCVTHKCTRAGIYTEVEKCLDPPHGNCEDASDEGSCCPSWRCGPDCSLVKCPSAPNKWCDPYRPPLACCDEWKCRGCFDEDGNQHEVGTKWSDDPCSTSECTEAGIQVARKYCLPVQKPHHSCVTYTPEGECCSRWNCSACLDDAGEYHDLNSVWKVSPCITHTCTWAGIRTQVEKCIDKPHSNCENVSVEGSCCPSWQCGPDCRFVKCAGPPNEWCTPVTRPLACCDEWNCRGCVDELGNHREVGSKWSSDSCNTSECTPSGVKVTLKYCPTLPKPHHSCRSYVPEGECCPRWECSACLDDNGEYHDLYSVWQETPCIRHQCTRAGIHTRVEKCSDQPHSNCEVVPNEGQCCQSWRCGADCSNVQCAGAPSSDCTSHRPPLACCDEWTCSGCVDLEEYHELGSQWKSDPCSTSLCTDIGIKVTRQYCSKLPRPHHSCVTYTPEGECCPKWNCSACLDNAGVYHDMDSEWQTSDCVTHKCTLAGIHTKIEECLEPPHSNCQEVPGEGRCCPSWQCGPDCSLVKCPEPPNMFCRPHKLPLACCDEWECRGCVDELNNHHNIGSEWSNKPCSTSVCTETGINVTRKYCSALKRPHPSCRSYTPEGECCPKWNCSACLGDDGKYHRLNSVWKESACVSLKCTRAGIRKIVQKCPDAPHSNCEEIPAGNKCCPTWKCGPDCRLVKCRGPPSEDCSPYRPPLACCYEWNCSGCIDEEGKHHEIGREWATGPCITSVCTEDGVKVMRKSCRQLPKPHEDCSLYTPVRTCCPKWNCSGCVDLDGTYHVLGSRWSTDDPCTTLVCTSEGIRRTVKQCEKSLPPYPICSMYIPVGECCPSWNCSGCIDVAGRFHKLLSKWDDKCSIHTCTTHGIKSNKRECEKAAHHAPAATLILRLVDAALNGTAVVVLMIKVNTVVFTRLGAWIPALL
nr:kielin/chordin-like protein isoform X3 [Cherax quadricarinatus]